MVCPNCGTLNENNQSNCRKCTKPLRPAHMKGKIPCHIHANREAITSCGVCGVRLCGPCTINHNGIDYCDSCAPAEAVRPSFEEDYESLPVLDPATAGRARLQPNIMALLIDVFIFAVGAALFGVVAFLITGATFVFNRSAGGAFYGFWVFIGFCWIVYNVIATAMTGQTFGRRTTNVIVLKPDGRLADLQSAIIRGLGEILSLIPFGLGYLWVFFDPARETWHDKLAGTAVYEYEEVS
ncbi:MAG: hypothetical protein OHK0029_17340 [Armatimonadaceae bacterium]